jgi:hypothetical protein
MTTTLKHLGLEHIGVWRGVSKGVEDGHRSPALRAGHPYGLAIRLFQKQGKAIEFRLIFSRNSVKKSFTKSFRIQSIGFSNKKYMADILFMGHI